MIYENTSDRSQQTPVVNVVTDFLTAYPVVGTDLTGKSWWKLVETPKRLMEHHDFDIYFQGRFVGVGEIKCRTGKYTREYFEQNDVLVNRGQLKKLYYHHRHGRHVVLVIRTSDNRVLMTTMMRLKDAKAQIQPAPDGFIKDDHGNRPSKRKGVLIPFEIFTDIGTTDGT